MKLTENDRCEDRHVRCTDGYITGEGGVCCPALIVKWLSTPYHAVPRPFLLRGHPMSCIVLQMYIIWSRYAAEDQNVQKFQKAKAIASSSPPPRGRSLMQRSSLVTPSSQAFLLKSRSARGCHSFCKMLNSSWDGHQG